MVKLNYKRLKSRMDGGCEQKNEKCECSSMEKCDKICQNDDKTTILMIE